MRSRQFRKALQPIASFYTSYYPGDDYGKNAFHALTREALDTIGCAARSKRIRLSTSPFRSSFERRFNGQFVAALILYMASMTTNELKSDLMSAEQFVELLP